MCNLLPFASKIVCTNLDLDKANGEFLFCIQAASYYTEVALENVTKYSKNEGNAFRVSGVKTRVQEQLPFNLIITFNLTQYREF